MYLIWRILCIDNRHQQSLEWLQYRNCRGDLMRNSRLLIMRVLQNIVAAKLSNIRQLTKYNNINNLNIKIYWWTNLVWPRQSVVHIAVYIFAGLQFTLSSVTSTSHRRSAASRTQHRLQVVRYISLPGTARPCVTSRSLDTQVTRMCCDGWWYFNGSWWYFFLPLGRRRCGK